MSDTSDGRSSLWFFEERPDSDYEGEPDDADQTHVIAVASTPPPAELERPATQQRADGATAVPTGSGVTRCWALVIQGRGY